MYERDDMGKVRRERERERERDTEKVKETKEDIVRRSDAKTFH